MKKNLKYKVQSPQQIPGKNKVADKKKFSGGIPKWAVAGVLVLTAVLYLKALQNGLVGYDDKMYLNLNPYIKDCSLHGIKVIFSSFYFANYHPLTTLIYMFEYAWFGLNPLPYHMLNLVLHLINVWLVFKLAERLSGKRNTALVVSLLFALHPMHVESVAWVSETKDVLYACFYLLSLILYMRYIESAKHKQYYYAGAFILFILSLLSKSAAVTLPVLLIAVDLYKGRKRDRRFYLEKIPFFACSIFFGALAVVSQNAIEGGNTFSYSYGWIDKIFLNTYAISFYIVKSVVSFHLSAIHFLPDNRSGFLPWAYYASPILLAGLAWLILRKTSFRKELIFGISFFLISVSVMLQISQVGNAIVAERYTYLSYIGLFYPAGQWISDIIRKRKQSTVVIAIFSLLLLIFIVQTWTRTGVWKDEETLIADAIEKDPASYVGYQMRGENKHGNGKLQEALIDIEKSLNIDSTDYKTWEIRAMVYYDLGNMNAAMHDFNKVISLKPDFADAFINRGMVYIKLGDIKSGFSDFGKAISMNPRCADAYDKRGSAYGLIGDTLAAMRDYDKAVQTDPYSADAYNNRGFLKAKLCKDREAIIDYNYAIKFAPDKGVAYFNRGVSKLHLKDSNGACNDWGKAAHLGFPGAEQFIYQYCH
jgi:protein O-mannosyl-transferase